MHIVYAATLITIGNSCKIPFWETSWLGGLKSLEIAPLIQSLKEEKMES
jgi:hypothetical protein